MSTPATAPRHRRPPGRARAPALALAALLAALAGLAGLPGASGPAQARGTAAAAAPARSDAPPLPPTLSATGFFADAGAGTRLAFSPQYPLWSDAADKDRLVALPAGGVIDARDADAWVFPNGTRFWKTFAHGGQPVETRFIQRGEDGRWRYATYVWRADGRDADLAPPEGVQLPVAQAPRGVYRVPSRADCLACHGGAMAPVLGFAALQLSDDRDPAAPHGQPLRPGEATLRSLLRAGLLQGLPPALADAPPRIPAQTALARATLGYLHGNCAHCHHARAGRVPLALDLAQRAADPAAGHAAVLASLVGSPSRYQPPELDDPRVVVPGEAAHSVIALRMASREPSRQMPPLGTAQVDATALALLARWIDSDLSQPSVTKEP